METKQEIVKPLTPDIAGPNYPARSVDLRKHISWLHDFSVYQPPADQKILVRTEEKK